jgi:hypothetical protein
MSSFNTLLQVIPIIYMQYRASCIVSEQTGIPKNIIIIFLEYDVKRIYMFSLTNLEIEKKT